MSVICFINMYKDFYRSMNLKGYVFVVVKDIESCEVPLPRKLLVLINPFSGPGKALQIFQNGVSHMLEEADISFKLVITGKLEWMQASVCCLTFCFEPLVFLLLSFFMNMLFFTCSI